MVIFVTLCEGYLGIPPHFELWKYFFRAVAFFKSHNMMRDPRVPVRARGCAIQLR